MGHLISTNRQKWVKVVKAKRGKKSLRGKLVDYYNHRCGYYCYNDFQQKKTLPRPELTSGPCLQQTVLNSNFVQFIHIWKPYLCPHSAPGHIPSELVLCFYIPQNCALSSWDPSPQGPSPACLLSHVFLAYSFLTTLASQGFGISLSAGNCSTRLCSPQPHIPHTV